MDNSFRDGFVQTTGAAITKVLPQVSRFTPTGDRTKKRETVIEKLTAFLSMRSYLTASVAAGEFTFACPGQQKLPVARKICHM